MNILLKNTDLRIDSEFYKKRPFEYKNYKYVPIGDILKNDQYGISIEMNENRNGHKIYRMNEIHNMLTDIDVEKYANISTNELESFKLHDRDVLFNRTNSFEWVGRTGLYRKVIDDEFVFASYLIRFNPDENYILPEFLVAFLNSKLGIWDIKRRARISINQSNVNAQEVKAIKIPLVDIMFQKEIKKLFDNAHNKRINSQKIFLEAEKLISTELGFDNFALSNECISKNITLSNIKKNLLRFDSEFYLPKYEEIIKKIINYKNGFEKLEVACNLKDTNKQLIKDKEYKYIELSNIGTTGEITGYTIEVGLKLPTRAKRLIHTNDVIISSIEGSIDKVALVRKEHNESICSTGFYVLNSNFLNSETLLVLFKNKIYKELLIQNSSGTILTAINKEEFLNLLIPKIDTNVQTKIQEKIHKSFHLKENSIELLTLVKRAVNIAIENNEEVALKYIKENINA